MSSFLETTVVVNEGWRRFREDLPSLALLLLLLVIATGGVVAASWAEGSRYIVAIALVGLLAGYLLARSTFSAFTTVLIASTYGAFVIGLQQTLTLSSNLPLRMRSIEVLRRFAGWMSGLISERYVQDNRAFVLLLGLVVWMVAFNAAWNIFRTGRLWRAALLPGIGLTISNFYYSGPANLDLLLPLYLLVLLTLSVYTNAVTRKSMWREQGVVLVAGKNVRFLLPGLLASMLLLGLAWLVPAAPASERLADVWGESVAPRLDIQETWKKLFATVNGTAAPPQPVEYYASQSLTLGGPVNLADIPVMEVFAPQGPRYYWRSKVFDTFDGRSWSTTSDARLSSDFGVLYYEDAAYQQRRNVRQRFELSMSASRLIYSASQPVSVGLPVTFDVQFIDRNQERGSPTEVQVEPPLFAGDAYEVISSISYADEPSLRAAGTDYPAWVLRTYLQLPELTSERTLELAKRLTMPYDNPFDRAQAVERWLRENIAYDESIEGPPLDADAVDWMLFEEQAAYCSYYATAMVVMLRSQGIPARVAAGFAQGAYDGQLGSYRVLESDAHTWVEVYFPGFGWIEFEPTAARPGIAQRGIPIEDGSEVAQTVAGADTDVAQLQQEQPVLPESETQSGGIIAVLFGEGFFAGELVVIAMWALGVLVASVLVGGALGWREASKRGLRGLSGVARIYAGLNMLVAWLGVHIPASYTPHERATVLADEVPESAASIGEISTLFVQERFAPPARVSVEERKEANVRASAAFQAARPLIVRRIIRRWLRLRR